MDCFLWNWSELFLLILVKVFFLMKTPIILYKPPWNICVSGQQNKKIQLTKKYRENQIQILCILKHQLFFPWNFLNFYLT